MFVGLLSVCIKGSFGQSLISNTKGSKKCLTLNNWPCEARPTLVNINFDKALFIHLLFVLISVMEVVILLIIRMFEFAFQVK